MRARTVGSGVGIEEVLWLEIAVCNQVFMQESNGGGDLEHNLGRLCSAQEANRVESSLMRDADEVMSDAEELRSEEQSSRADCRSEESSKCASVRAVQARAAQSSAPRSVNGRSACCLMRLNSSPPSILHATGAQVNSSTREAHHTFTHHYSCITLIDTRQLNRSSARREPSSTA